MATRWDLNNARPQCEDCNQLLNGNTEVFAERLLEDLGEEIFNSLEVRSREVTNLSIGDIRELRLGIERKLKKLRKDKNL